MNPGGAAISLTYLASEKIIPGDLFFWTISENNPVYIRPDVLPAGSSTLFQPLKGEFPLQQAMEEA
jgi:hypothetical protein